MAREDWVKVALRRTPNILRRVRYASLRQLESKVCEAGPGHMRPNPIHLTEAVRSLVDDRVLVLEHVPHPHGTFPTFYTPRDFSLDIAADAARRQEVLALYEVFQRALRDDMGKALERMVFTAALEAQRAGQFHLVIGSPDRPPDQNLVLNGVEIEQALDLILVSSSGLVAVEDKNLREWLTPGSLEVWELIGKALRLDALPVLICRKVTYDLFLLFKQIGGLAFQNHHQVFPADFAMRLAAARHKDGLGFADMRFGDEPDERLRHFFASTLPRNLEAKLAEFRERRELLEEFAFGRLEEDIPGAERSALYREFFRRLKGWDEDVPPEGYEESY